MKTIKTVKDLAEWIRENVPGKDEAPNEALVKEAIWVLACYEARLIFETCTTKELAQEILKGRPAFGVVEAQKTLDALEEGTEEDQQDYIKSILECHYGIFKTN